MKNLITIPRIIGIVLVALAILSYNTQQGIFRAGLLAIAGLILLLANSKSAANNWQLFVNTFKLKKEFAVIMLLDALFWAALAVLMLITATMLRKPYEQMKSIQVGEGFIQNLGAYNAIIENFFVAVAVAVALFWIATIIAYTFSRGMIWLALLNKKAPKKFFLRFGLVNLLWYTVWVVVILFFMANLTQPFGAAVFVILIVLYTHLTTVLHYSYVKHNVFGKSMRDAFGIGLGGLGRFAQPYCYLFIIYIILFQIQSRISYGTLALIVAFIIFLAFMAWYRKYLRDVLKHV